MYISDKIKATPDCNSDYIGTVRPTDSNMSRSRRPYRFTLFPNSNMSRTRRPYRFTYTTHKSLDDA